MKELVHLPIQKYIENVQNWFIHIITCWAQTDWLRWEKSFAASCPIALQFIDDTS